MPHVTIAKSQAFSLDPRAISQLDWATTTATIATGRHVSRSTIIRFALAQVAERLSWLIENDNLDAARTYLERLPAYARCDRAKTVPATDKSGHLMPWRSIAH